MALGWIRHELVPPSGDLRCQRHLCMIKSTKLCQSNLKHYLKLKLLFIFCNCLTWRPFNKEYVYIFYLTFWLLSVFEVFKYEREKTIPRDSTWNSSWNKFFHQNATIISEVLWPFLWSCLARLDCFSFLFFIFSFFVEKYVQIFNSPSRNL